MAFLQQSLKEMSKDELFSFFLVVPPGLEKPAHLELSYWLPSDKLVKLQILHGGLLVELPLDVGISLNYLLKVPSRVLLRLTSFRCRDFNKLYKNIKKFDWNSWVGGAEIEWVVASKNSRVKIKSRIEETCKEGFASYRKAFTPKEAKDKSAQTIFVRLNDDLCEISLDTTGEHLHRRGYKTLSSEAPIRENIAAALLWWMIGSGLEKLSEVYLYDPMTGSGTFSIEASRLFQESDQREYAFRGTPLGGEFEASKNSPQVSFHKISASDQNDKAVLATRGNIENARSQKLIEVQQSDFFEQSFSEERSWVIVNPPYGQRLEIGEKEEVYFNRLVRHVLEKRVELLGCIFPRQIYHRIRKNYAGYKEQEPLKFKNGGIDVIFAKWQRLK